MEQDFETKIRMLLRKGYSPEGIAKSLNISVDSVRDISRRRTQGLPKNEFHIIRRVVMPDS